MFRVFTGGVDHDLHVQQEGFVADLAALFPESVYFVQED
jgi:hypothetical protein